MSEDLDIPQSTPGNYETEFRRLWYSYQKSLNALGLRLILYWKLEIERRMYY